jgi:hypothetical protein
MDVWMYGCMDVWMDGWMDVRVDVWVCVYLCMYVCMYVMESIPFFIGDTKFYFPVRLSCLGDLLLFDDGPHLQIMTGQELQG